MNRAITPVPVRANNVSQAVEKTRWVDAIVVCNLTARANIANH
jgi:hypothetical protein